MCPSKKLDHRFLGPFRSWRKCRHMLPSWSVLALLRIHPVFHVSLLQPIALVRSQQSHGPPPPIKLDDSTSGKSIESLTAGSIRVARGQGYCIWSSGKGLTTSRCNELQTTRAPGECTRRGPGLHQEYLISQPLSSLRRANVYMFSYRLSH